MNEIHAILEKLGELIGVKGAALLTSDGMMVDSTLGQEFVEDIVAGLSSFLIATTHRSLREAGLEGGFHRFVLTSTHGKVTLVELGESFLIVVCNQFTDMSDALVDIQKAASALRRVAKIQL